MGSGYVSDRRLRRAADLLKAAAAAHGRSSVGVLDALAVLPHVLWEEEEEAAALTEWVEEEVLPEGGAEQLSFLLASIRGRVAAVAGSDAQAPLPAGHLPNGEVPSEVSSAEEQLLLAEVSSDAAALASAALDAAVEMEGHAAAIADACGHLFLAPQQATAVMQRLLPEARARAEELRELATNAVALELGLAEGSAHAALLILLMEARGVAEAAQVGRGVVHGEQLGVVHRARPLQCRVLHCHVLLGHKCHRHA